MSSSPRFVAAVFVRDLSHRYTPTVRSLLRAGASHVIVGAVDASSLSSLVIDDRVELVEAADAPTLVNTLSERFQCPVIACDEPVVVAPDCFGPTLRVLESDPRVATVGYWCNFAGYLSFPHHNSPSSHQQGDLDEVSGTARLRSRQPTAELVALPLARGPLIAISRKAITACGSLEGSPFGDLTVSLAAFGLRCADRGFVNVLDPSTYVVRPFDLAAPTQDIIDNGAVRAWLHSRHSTFPALYDSARVDPQSPVAQAHALARAQAEGLRILVDGSVLGPLETGTQVHLMCLVAALAGRDDVREIVVSVPGPVPSYATAAFSSQKITAVIAPDGSFPPDLRFDVVHRPFQPDRPLPWEHWRSVARRVIITVQDLIAYRIGQYHSSPEQWLAYRHNLVRSSSAADAVVVFLEDVAEAIRAERLPIDRSRIGIVPCGTDHLTGQEPARPPAPFLAAELVSERFLVILGTTYAHKNRDLGIRAWSELVSRGYRLRLVMVGAQVPFGSSREAEAQALGIDDTGVIDLLDATSHERNWLLRHAEVVMYPTSAEGFGLVPFEAARFGTPTVAVSFGPLAEMQPDVPEAAESWSASHLADSVARLLDDADLARATVRATLDAGDVHTWAAAAEKLVEVYRGALASPVSISQLPMQGV